MYSFQSRIRYSEVDSKGRMTELALMDYFQDCSVFHSENVQVGVEYLKEHHLAWILLSWQIQIEQMPGLAEEVTIATWPYDMKGFYGYRNFSMNTASGQRLAYANSIWALIDMETGRPVRVPEMFAQAYGMEEQLPMGELERKLRPLPDGAAQKSIVVPPYFIDTNQHMNNSKYLLVAQQYLPADFNTKEISVEYRKAALLGDVIYPVVAQEQDVITVELNGEDGKPYAILKFRRV